MPANPTLPWTRPAPKAENPSAAWTHPPGKRVPEERGGADEGESGHSVSVEALAKVAKPVRFWKGDLIGIQGQPCRQIYVVLKGQLLMSRSRGGEPRAVEVVGPVHLIGEEALRPARCWERTVKALTHGRALALPGSLLSAVSATSPEVATELLSLLVQRLNRTTSLALIAATPGAVERVRSFLAALAADREPFEGTSGRIRLHVTRVELAQILGLARETVARALTELEIEGIVARGGRGDLFLLRGDRGSGLSAGAGRS